MRLYISHGADPDDPDWFIVEPREGNTRTSVAGTEITPEMEIGSLLRARRTVYQLDVTPFTGTLASLAGRNHGTVHIGLGHMGTASPELRRQRAEESRQNWERSGYRVVPVPRNGGDHVFNEPCPACAP